MDGNNINNQENLTGLAEANALDFYTRDTFKALTPGAVAYFKNDIHFNVELYKTNNGISGFIQKAENYQELETVFREAGLLYSRPTTIGSDMLVYLMGREKDSISLEQAMQLTPDSPDFKKYFDEFVEFCKSHPLESDSKYLKDYIDLFNNCAKKIGEYTIPDIDYNNPEQVREHEKEFHFLTTFLQDFEQEEDRILRKDLQATEKLEGGKAGVIKARKNESMLNSFISGYKVAYEPADLEAFAHDFKKEIREMAVSRAAFGLTAEKWYRGKKVSNLVEKNPRASYADKFGIAMNTIVMTDRSIKYEDGLEFLRGNKPQVLDVVKNLTEKAEESCRTGQNEVMYYLIGTVHDRLEIADADDNTPERLTEIFAEGTTPEKSLELLKAGESEKLRGTIRSLFNELFEKDGMRFVYECAGINDPLAIFKVNGKTLEELYSGKYEFINDPVEKDLMYKAELLNHIYHSRDSITMDIYAIDKDGKAVQDKPVILFGSPMENDKIRVYLSEIKDFRTAAKDLYTRVYTRQQIQPEAEARQTGLDYFRSFDGLSKVLNYKGNYSLTKMNEKIEEVKEKANAYYTLQRSIMLQKSRDQGDIKTLDEEKKLVLDTLDKHKKALNDAAKEANAVPGEHTSDSVYTNARFLERIKKNYSIRSEGDFSLEDEIRYSGEILFLQDVNAGNLTKIPDDKYREIERILDLRFTNSIAHGFNQAGVSITEDPAYPAGHMNTNATTRVADLFNMWAMAKAGLSVKEVAKLMTGPVVNEKGEITNQADLDRFRELKTQFIDFIKKYPMKEQENETAKAKEERIKQWLEVWAGARKVIEDYTMPDVSYDDIYQMKDYLRELSVLSGIGINGVQEWEKLCLNNLTVSAKAAGGEKALFETRDFYHGIQDLFKTRVMKGYEPVDPDDKTYAKVGLVARYRYYAKMYMNKHRGQKVLNVLEAEKNSMPLEEMSHAFTYSFASTPGYTDFKLPISHILGYNGKAFEQETKKLHNDGIRKFKEDYIRDRYTNIRLYKENVMKPDFKARLLQTGDDVQSMRNLLTTPVFYKEAERPLNDVISEEFQIKFLGSYLGNISRRMGYSLSDLFVVDGKKPSEIWGDKYKDVQNADEKEYLYRLEVLKCFAKGNADIQIRNFKLDEKGVEEMEPVDCIYNRARMDVIMRGASNYEAKRDDMISTLEDMKAQLITTQSNSNANFGSDRKEGSPEYQRFTNAIQNAIDVLKRDAAGQKVDPDEIALRLHSLQTYANEYYNTHVGRVFGPQTNDGVLRLNMSFKGREDWEARFKAIRAPFECNLPAETDSRPVMMKDASFVKIKRVLDSEKFTSLYGYTPIADPVHRKQYVRSELIPKLLLRKSVLASRDDSDDKEEKKLATRYLLAYFEARTKIIGPGENEPSYSISDLRKIEHFDEKVKELAANPIFVRRMKENPEKCIRNFHETEDRANLLMEQCLESRASRVVRYGSEIKSVFKIGAEDQKTPLAALREINAAENAQERLEQTYNELANLVLEMVLSANTKEGERFRQEIAENGEKQQEYLALTKNYLTRKNALSENNLNTTIRNVENFSYAKEMLKRIQTHENNLAQEKKRQAKADYNTAVHDFEILTNPEHVLTQEEYNSFCEKTGFGMAYELTEQLDQSANQLMNLNYKAKFKEEKVVTVQNENGENQQVVEEREIEETINLPNVLRGIGLSPDRPTSTQMVFVMYLMAKHDMELTDAYDLANKTPQTEEERTRQDSLRKEFILFARKNMVNREDAPMHVVENSLKEWADVYKAATLKMMNTKFPEVNFRDPQDVKKHAKELYAAIALCIDIDQEFAGIFKNNERTNALKVIQNRLGSEDEFNRLRSFWFSTSGILEYLNFGLMDRTIKPSSYVDRPAGELHRKIESVAPVSMLASDQLNALCGRSFGQIFESDKVKGAVVKQYVNDVRAGLTEYGLNHEDYHKNAVRFMYKKGEMEFRKGIKDTLDGYLADTRQKLLHGRITNATYFRNNLTNDDGLQKLKNIPDNDADAMREFLRSEVSHEGKTITGDIYLLLKMTGEEYALFDDTKQQICAILGIKASDTVLIDGKRPEEIWGEKYENVEDPVEKEQLFRAEILKEFALCRNRIEVRHFAVEDDKIVEAPKQLVMTERVNLMEIARDFHVYEAAKEDILSQLHSYRQTFIDTQEDKNANFYGNETEGNTKEYKELTRTLRHLIYLLEQEVNDTEIKKEDILQAFDEFNNAAREYESTHTGWFTGRWSNNAVKRRTTSADIQRELPILKEWFSDTRNKYAGELGASGGQTFANGNYYYQKIAVEGIENNYDIPKEQAQVYRNKFRDDVLKKHIRKAMETDFAPSENIPNPENYKTAWRYINYKLNRKSMAGSLTFEDLKTLLNMDSEIREYMENPLLMKLDKNDRFEGFKRFLAAEEKTEAKLEECSARLNGIVNEYGSLSTYIRQNQDPEQLYDRLSEVVMLQLLTAGDKNAKYFAQAMAVEDDTFEQMKAEVIIIFRDEAELLEGDENSIRRVMEQVDDGSLAREYADELGETAVDHGARSNRYTAPDEGMKENNHAPEEEQPVINIFGEDGMNPEENNIDINENIIRLNFEPENENLQIEEPKNDIENNPEYKEIFEKAKAAEESLIKQPAGLNKDGVLNEEKLQAFITVATANVIKRRNGLKNNQTPASVQKELFGDKESADAIIYIAEKYSGEQMADIANKYFFETDFDTYKLLAKGEQKEVKGQDAARQKIEGDVNKKTDPNNVIKPK